MKKVGIIKRIFALLLVFLLSINSFAAVVSDNDGSAFITKAEFDSLKNNFQSQIDQYNQSIDAKIDGAIASYLSGIKLDTAKKYKFFGGVENEDGKRWITSRLYMLYTSSWSSSDYGVWGYSNSWDNLGFGQALWVCGCAAGALNKVAKGDQCTGFIQKSGYPSSLSLYISNDISKTSLSGLTFKSYSNWTTTQLETNRAVCSYHLSVAYGQRVPVWDPEMILIEFLDSGDAEFDFRCVANGYVYEHGVRPGYNSVNKAFEGNSGSYLAIKHSDGTLDKLLMGNAYTTDNAIKHFAVHVNGGDKLILFCKSSSADGTTTSYTILRTTADIPGWEVDNA